MSKRELLWEVDRRYSHELMKARANEAKKTVAIDARAIVGEGLAVDLPALLVDASDAISSVKWSEQSAFSILAAAT